jgi:ubiquinone/menaquinone biosynthesis C-methylase UbiE
VKNSNDKARLAYNRKADNYENTLDGKFTRKFKRLLVENIKLEENQSILDVACGNGFLLALLNQQKNHKCYATQ